MPTLWMSDYERLFYIREAALNHWNLDQLSAGIKRDDFHHRGAMPSNFMATIPDTALARKTLDMFRDEYLLDFVNLDDIEVARLVQLEVARPNGYDVASVHKLRLPEIKRRLGNLGRKVVVVRRQRTPSGKVSYRVEPEPSAN